VDPRTKTRGINSDRLLTEFNGGAVDSFPDPELCVDTIAEERVAVTAKRSLVRGFASQGSDVGPTVSRWLREPKVRNHLSVLVHARRRQRAPEPPPRPELCTPKPRIPEPRLPPPSTTPGQGPPTPGNEELANDQTAQWFRQELFRILHDELARDETLPDGAICGGRTVTRVGRLHADAARLSASLELAAMETAQMIDEEIVTWSQGVRGMERALDEAAAYLAARRWRPSTEAPTLGITIKGGASSGVYSAGVTWRALTLLMRYRDWKAANPRARGIDPEDARFVLAAGTSAGAIIAAAVDLFHQDACVLPPEATEIRKDPRVGPDPNPFLPLPATGTICQEYARRLLATVFTCVDQGSLYCVDSRPIWSLVGEQKGLMDFDGLRALIGKHVGPLAPVNPTELVLTTVDFRWGELYVQTDQDPSTVRQPPPFALGTPETLADLHASIEASFVLPFIAWPVEELHIAGKPRPGVYLDGGIKSEIPIIALAQRGAERTLVVGSAPPRITPTRAQTSAMTIAARYLDVSLSAVTESEWNAVMPYAGYVETIERAACESLFRGHPQQPSKLAAFCNGQLDGGCGGEERDRSFERYGIFRREDIDPSIGYTFDPTQMRRLFDAGTEAARANCLELTKFLGMDDVPAGELDAWCNETPKTEPGLCKENGEDYTTCAHQPEDHRAAP
jgi:predicted acylesterase/phospholipase RssA